MTNWNSILNELKDLESSLAYLNSRGTYTVPAGYFDGLADQVLNRIRSMEATSPKDELAILSPLLDSLSKEMPYSIPYGYFDSLGETLLNNIRRHPDYLNSEEEIESLSPVLSSLRDKNPYIIPETYFETLNTGVTVAETKVISITRRRWYRLAAAAVFVGIISIGALLFVKQNKIDPNKNPQAWIEKNVEKKVSSERIDAFVTLATGEELMNNNNPKEIVKPEEIKELMKDVSEKEIQDFLNDAVALESNDETDAMLN